MTALKADGVERFLRQPDASRPFVLIYGPDLGLVSERSRLLATAAVDDLNDPFAVIRLDGDTLASDPARLADEVGTLPMFGGRRLIWVRAGDRPFTQALEAALSIEARDCMVLIEAGDLKKTQPVRALAEKSPRFAAIACYSDGVGDLRALIASETRDAGLEIDRDAVDLLLLSLGGDRAASRAEIRKLCLYAMGTPRITAADVEAVSGDAAAIGLDAIIDAAAGGDRATLDRLLAKAAAAGVAIPQILSAMSRHLMTLHKARVAVERGLAIGQAVDRIEPKVFYKRRDLMERQLRLWSAAKLERMIQRVATATFETRVKAALADAIVNRTLMAIAVAAQPSR